MQNVLLAVSDPVRLRALHVLWGGGEHCVCELMARLDVSQSRISRHMKVLKLAGLVAGRRDAQWMRYRQNPDLAPEITAVVDAILKADRMNERNVA
jgi:ArsR family transcriptional regulator